LILNRYIILEIIRPMLAICAVLVAVFASYSAAEYLADAVAGLMRPDAVLLMILLRIAIALEVLLPTTLYLSVVIALGRLYRDSEMVALSSCGIGTPQILKPVFYLALVIAILVGGLSLYVRPWAYGQIYRLKANAQSNFDIAGMEAGTFYEIEAGSLVIFAAKVDHQNNRMKQVFIRSQDDETLQVISAKEVDCRLDEKSGNQVLFLHNGHMYEFQRQGSKGKVTQFAQARYILAPKEVIPKKYRRRAAATLHLIGTDDPENIGELQWRLSTFFSTILLALLGVPLSRTTPRQGKYAKVIIAVVIFAVYYNISAVAKSWVEKGFVGPVPGTWWVQVLLAAILAVLLWNTGEVFRKRL
jgi:lipopolysaccharide export system permease protein